MLPTPPASPTFAACVPEDRLGLLLADRLRLTSVLGVGAYGVVYTARDIFTGRDYAVKALNKLGLDSRQQRFQQREIQLHYEASAHPNVVSLLQILEAEDTTYVVLEYCPEGDLFASITERLFYAGNDELVRSAFLQILDAVAFCHSRGIYHRDLKPENILVADGGHTLRLADFGLATREKVTADFGCGSTFYMSSECQTAAPTAQSCYASAPNDVWSLGVILINLACGRNPWKRASLEDATFRAFLRDPSFLSTILPISPELELILSRIFERDPTLRIRLPELRELILQCPRFGAGSVSAPAPVPAPAAPLTPPPTTFDADVVSPADILYDSAACAAMPPSPPATPPSDVVFASAASPPSNLVYTPVAPAASHLAYTPTTPPADLVYSPADLTPDGLTVSPHMTCTLTGTPFMSMPAAPPTPTLVAAPLPPSSSYHYVPSAAPIPSGYWAPAAVFQMAGIPSIPCY